MTWPCQPLLSMTIFNINWKKGKRFHLQYAPRKNTASSPCNKHVVGYGWTQRSGYVAKLKHLTVTVQTGSMFIPLALKISLLPAFEIRITLSSSAPYTAYWLEKFCLIVLSTAWLTPEVYLCYGYEVIHMTVKWQHNTRIHNMYMDTKVH